MRLAFWRAGMAKALVEKTLAVPAPAVTRPVADPPSGDLDLRAKPRWVGHPRQVRPRPNPLAGIDWNFLEDAGHAGTNFQAERLIPTKRRHR